MKNTIRDINRSGSPWLTPMDTKLLGGLRGMVRQFSDGTGNTLVPRNLPSYKKSTFSYIAPQNP